MNRRVWLIPSVSILLVGLVLAPLAPAQGEAQVEFPVRASLTKLLSLMESCALSNNSHREKSNAVSVFSDLVEQGLYQMEEQGRIKAKVAEEFRNRLLSNLGSFQGGAVSGEEFAREMGILGDKVGEEAPRSVVVILRETALGQALVENSGLLSKRPGNLTPEEVSSLVESVSAKVKAGLPSVGSPPGKGEMGRGGSGSEAGGPSLFQGKWKDPDQRSIMGHEEKKKGK